MNAKKGFTIIELIIVMAIIAVLAAIIMVNISQYIEKAKIARANTDVRSIQEALEMFYAQYGDYPYSQGANTACPSNGCDTFFYSSSEGGPGEPYLTVGGIDHPLSEFYKSDWDNYNADYFIKNGFYAGYLYDNDGDKKIGCGSIYLIKDDLNDPEGVKGEKNVLCQDCPENCGATFTPFSTQ